MQGEPSDASSGDGQVTLRIAGAVAHIQFDRPWARNAMTWAMYDGFAAACTAINGNSRVRVAVLRGAGGKAFVAGTDIAQFREFANGDDGVAYEAKLDSFIDGLERLHVPSIAVVEGVAAGAGLAIANACDIRLAASGARFGVSDRTHLGQLPFGCQLASALRHARRQLGETNVVARRDADGGIIASDRISGGGRTAGGARCRSRAALQPIARARAAHDRGNTGNLATPRMFGRCRYRGSH